jgi:hypothetical protein
MASLNVVQTGVEKASKVSHRSGKWATPKEIDLKTNPKQTPLQQLLTQLVKDSRIEKKSGMLLYRPQKGAGPGGQGEGIPDRGKPDRGDRWKPRRPDGKKPGRRDDGKKPDRPDRRDKPHKPDRDDAAERERRRKRDEIERRRREAAKAKKKFVHPKDRKSKGRRDVSRTIARGVATRAVASGISQGIAPRAIQTAILG